jgi:hypothetical protein
MKKFGVFTLILTLAVILTACNTSSAVTDTSTDSNTTANTTAANVLYSEDFSDPSSGWEVGDYTGGSVGYGDGFYSVSSNGSDASGSAQIMWGVYTGVTFSDMDITFDTTQVAAPADNNNAYGILTRRSGADLGSCYAFFISGDGYFAIMRFDSGTPTYLIDWTASSAINLGNATNNLRVVNNGAVLSWYVNGTLLGEVTDSTYSTGEISLVAISFETEATQIQFDNLVVTQP